MQIAILYSCPTDSYIHSDVVTPDGDTVNVARAIAKTLQQDGMSVKLYPVTAETLSSISSIRADCIFNLIEWTGNDMGVAKAAFVYLDALGIPYTGVSFPAYEQTSDKYLSKQVFDGLDIPTPRWAIWMGTGPIPEAPAYPAIIKPAREHSSIGISDASVVHSNREMSRKVRAAYRKHRQPILIEEFIKGRELLLYLYEKEGRVEVMTILEQDFTRNDGFGIQTYDVKWTPSQSLVPHTPLEPAKISATLKHAIEARCRTIFTQLELAGYARFDIRVDKNNHWFVLEANSNPNLYDETEPNGSPECTVAGISFGAYLQFIIQAAIGKNRGDTKTSLSRSRARLAR